MTNPKKIHLFWLVVSMVIAFPEMPVSAVDLQIGTPAGPQCFGISRGQHFVLGFSDNHDSRSETRELTILVVAFSNRQTSVTISSKYEVAGRPFLESFVIGAGGFRRTVLPAELVMEGTERSLKGIEISASSDVSAYGLMYQDFTTDGFLGIPTNNLGTQYVLVTGPPLSPWRSQFSVIGTEDSTLVQVTLRGRVTFEGEDYDAGDAFRFRVDQLEAVQIQGAPGQDLTGSIVQTNKPVAVFSGNECANNPRSTCDTLTEQLVPIKSWGKKHIYTSARSTDRNNYRIVAYFTETIVTIPGFGNRSLDTGEFWEGDLYGSGSVSSTEPTLMMQQLVNINGEQLDPSLIQVPAVEHFGFIFGFTTPPYFGESSEGVFNFIGIIVKTNARQTVFLNGSPINGTNVIESNVPNTDYTSLTVQLPKGEGFYFVEQTDSQNPLSVIVYGYENDESYGYAAGL
ncbi:IgGFc-binding protein-like [Patiria miniata]|uniref:IgGFc-binding protein N-terminal domain-containing protein n=1 Tax=Patiria miniata TaxID=46514 RepID=A0A914A7L6_PATMI|nr:IgGFc-binding protein-like [Patiria miniata]